MSDNLAGRKSQISGEAAKLLTSDSFKDEPYSDDNDDDSDDDHSDSCGDVDSTSYTSSGGQDTSTDQQEQEKKAVEELTRRETAMVATWRETATGILMIIGFVACVGTFIFMGREEHTQFQNSVSTGAVRWNDCGDCGALPGSSTFTVCM